MKLRVLTHSGEKIDVEVKKYDAAKLNKELNDNDVHTIELGGIILSRIDVKMVIPIHEETE